MWLVMSLVCIVAAMILYSRIQGDIPDELSFLKKSKKDYVINTDNALSFDALKNNSYLSGWYIKKDNLGNFEYTKSLDTPIEVDGNRLSPPELTFTCYERQLYISLNTRIGTNFYKKDESYYTDIDIKSLNKVLSSNSWLLGKNNKAFYEDKLEFLSIAQKESELKFSISYAGERKDYNLNMSGFPKLIGTIVNCEKVQK